MMAQKWSEIRRPLTPETEARIRQRVEAMGKLIALRTAETDPKLKILSETDPEAYLRLKQAEGGSESLLVQE